MHMNEVIYMYILLYLSIYPDFLYQMIEYGVLRLLV